MEYRISKAVLFFIATLLYMINTQNNICYTKCLEGNCQNSNPLACTACEDSFILINQKCVPTGGQSNSLATFNAVNQNNLVAVSTILRENRTIINCTIGSPQAGYMLFYNYTVSPQGVYFTDSFDTRIGEDHSYVQIKINAILFNQRNNPRVNFLIVNENDQDLVNQVIQANILQNRNVLCNSQASNTTRRSASYPFFINYKLSTSSSSLFMQFITLEIGDEIGISNYEVFYGNCHSSCATCLGAASNQCLSCNNFLKYDQATQSCLNCPSGFYQLSGSCLSCPMKCRTCEYSQTTGRPVCTQCLTGLNSTSIPTCNIYNRIFQSLQQQIFFQPQGWKSTQVLEGLATTCGSYSIVGGIPTGLGNSQVYQQFTNLQIHSQIWIKFTLLIIDQVPGTVYQGNVKVDDIIVYSLNIVIDSNQQNTTECGVQLLQFIDSGIIIPNISHTKSSVKIAITGSENYFGIRDFTLGIVNTTNVTNCVNINSTTNACTQCSGGLTLNNGICGGCGSNHYIKEGRCYTCSVFCKTCDEINCITCDKPLVFDNETKQCIDSGEALYTIAISPQLQYTKLEKWELYPKLQTFGISKCGNDTILGSNQILYRSLKMERTYTQLPQHQGATIYLYFYQIDDYDGVRQRANLSKNAVYFTIDQKTYPYKVANQGYQLCGNSSLDYVSKILIQDSSHTQQNLTLGIHGKMVKFGINRVMIFLQNCPTCRDSVVNYQVQIIPQYAIEQEIGNNLKVKLLFDKPVILIETSQNSTNEIFSFKVDRAQTNGTQVIVQQNNGQGTGNLAQLDKLTNTKIKQNRELIGVKKIFTDLKDASYSIAPQSPEDLFSSVSNTQGVLPIKLNQIKGDIPRYDYIDIPEDKTAMRNLRNFFRGIAVLAMWIGLISFFFGLSRAFDDLFILTQLIFVHIFIQSAYLSATFKVPVSGMKFVQFMAWLPYEAKVGIQDGIIPSNHYQRSPIIYEQYYQDITFARTIYHTILFLVIMAGAYIVIRLIRGLTRPTIQQIQKRKKQKSPSSLSFIRTFYFNIQSHPFVTLDKVIQFCYFTVVWAAILQFTWFQNSPTSFFQWNAALCIILFILFVAYPIAGFAYIMKKHNITSADTFNQIYGGLRIRRERLFYFIVRYFKLLAIALLIGLLYKANPLATLIPLMVIHLADAVLLIVLKPYHIDIDSNRVLSWFGKKFWVYYKWSHVIQNILFFILELILVIMYGRRKLDNQKAYFSTGYAASAFVILLLINGLIRLGWALIRYLEFCYDDAQSQHVKIESQDNDLQVNQIRNMNNPQTTRLLIDRHDNRKPSIEQSMAHQPVTLRN